MAKFKQEMPPPGGYAPFQFLRKISTPKIPTFRIFAAVIAYEVSSHVYRAFITKKQMWADRLEYMENEIVLQPYLEAEKERQVLKRMYENREEERELMKDVPGWVVGTWYGEKVFHNTADRFPPLSMMDMYMHSDPKEIHKRKYLTKFNPRY